LWLVGTCSCWIFSTYEIVCRCCRYHTRNTWIYPLIRKSNFFEVFVKFQKIVEKQFSKEIKIFQYDGGGEFIKTYFIKHLEDCGIVRHISCHNTPEQNGVSERKHSHIVETVLILLLHTNLPLFLWIEAFLTAVFLINRLPSTVLKMVSPFVKLYGEQSNYNSLKVFGCRCFPYIKGSNKFSQKTYHCVFI